ncbi:hypothetical protein BGW38_003525 [Lunasporangiospora selenospora]|uniref:Uncharacterized protein n=1 Tax=Lunasporangiospora selenospora TaxID=979761 RepID=A0A9P6FRD0_9FUNG|nr:hypothetical protein BGW38_003525 [Lunasporangiospora selenospora]
MLGSGSDDDDDDFRSNRKRRMPMMQGQSKHTSSSQSHPQQQQQQQQQPSGSGHHSQQQNSPPSLSPGSAPEVMDQVRSTLKLKQQQKAIIESRQTSHQQGPAPGQAPSSQQQQQQPSPSQQSQQPATNNGKPNSTNGGQAVTETNSSGVSVFHGSASFAALNRRALPSPKNPKNAKSLTIFAPSYSESALSIHSAPLQPSQSHQMMSMGLRGSQPLLQRHQHHPYAQAGSMQQPLRSPRLAGHSKKSSRIALRNTTSTADSGTLPAPILSSHTGPLPSPSMYPSTPFLPNPKHMFMDTVSSLFDSMDSSRSLKFTLEDQVRKSAQLLQTLQASGTMIENLVRGQFRELEKGVIERFENEVEHLNLRVRQLEEHLGLTPPSPPPKKNKTVVPPSGSSGSTQTGVSSSAMAGVQSTSSSTNGAGPSSGSAPTSTGVGTAATGTREPPNGSLNSSSSAEAQNQATSVKDGMLPTPPLTKSQDGSSSTAMEVEDDGDGSSPSATGKTSTEAVSEVSSTVKDLGERISNLEKSQSKDMET